MPYLDRPLTRDDEQERAASAGAPARKPKFWFEVEDFLVHFDHARHVTGIQRVCLEIFAEVERLYGASGRVGFCRLNRMTQEFEQVEFSAILETALRPPGADAPWHEFDLLVKRGPKRAVLARVLLGLLRSLERTVLPGVAQWIGRRFRRGRPADFLRPNDVVIGLGACWINPRYSRSVEAAKRDYGVRFALLIHDLIPLTHGSLVNSWHRTAFRKWIAGVLARADVVLTVSRYSREELIKAGYKEQEIPPTSKDRFRSWLNHPKKTPTK